MFFLTCFSEADLCSSETYQSYVYSHIFHDISVRLIAMYTHVFSDISVGLTRVTNFFSISRVSWYWSEPGEGYNSCFMIFFYSRLTSALICICHVYTHVFHDILVTTGSRGLLHVLFHVFHYVIVRLPEPIHVFSHVFSMFQWSWRGLLHVYSWQHHGRDRQLGISSGKDFKSQPNL